MIRRLIVAAEARHFPAYQRARDAVFDALTAPTGPRPTCAVCGGASATVVNGECGPCAITADTRAERAEDALS